MGESQKKVLDCGAKLPALHKDSLRNSGLAGPRAAKQLSALIQGTASV